MFIFSRIFCWKCDPWTLPSRYPQLGKLELYPIICLPLPPFSYNLIITYLNCPGCFELGLSSVLTLFSLESFSSFPIFFLKFVFGVLGPRTGGSFPKTFALSGDYSILVNFFFFQSPPMGWGGLPEALPLGGMPHQFQFYHHRSDFFLCRSHLIGTVRPFCLSPLPPPFFC